MPHGVGAKQLAPSNAEFRGSFAENRNQRFLQPYGRVSTRGLHSPLHASGEGVLIALRAAWTKLEASRVAGFERGSLLRRRSSRRRLNDGRERAATNRKALSPPPLPRPRHTRMGGVPAVYSFIRNPHDPYEPLCRTSAPRPISLSTHQVWWLRRWRAWWGLCLSSSPGNAPSLMPL